MLSSSTVKLFWTEMWQLVHYWVTTCLWSLYVYMPVRGRSVMCDLDAILAIVTNVNRQISSQMFLGRIAEPSSKKQTSCLSGSVWRPHTKSVFITHWWHSYNYPVHFRKGIYTDIFFFTQVLQDSNESFSLESNFPCLVAKSPALHSLMWSRTLTPVRPEQLQPLKDCHCWALWIAGLGL